MGFNIQADWTPKEMDGNVKLHRARYHFAKGYVEPEDRVLDLGAGKGYGSKILSTTAFWVKGIDMDAEQIEANKKNIVLDNVEFIAGNLEEIELPRAEIACMFEVLEHLYDPKKFVEKLKRSVDRWIIMSVPFACEKLIEVDGQMQADLDSTHHFVFPTKESLNELIVDDDWEVFFSFNIGVTYIVAFYNKNYEP
jgi:SAM-dependent methyltransferase